MCGSVSCHQKQSKITFLTLKTSRMVYDRYVSTPYHTVGTAGKQRVARASNMRVDIEVDCVCICGLTGSVACACVYLQVKHQKRSVSVLTSRMILHLKKKQQSERRINGLRTVRPHCCITSLFLFSLCFLWSSRRIYLSFVFLCLPSMIRV